MIQSKNEVIQQTEITLLERFFKEREHSSGTQSHYRSAVRLYEELNHMSLDELIQEAEREEEEGKRWKKRKLKERLMAYRSYVYGTKLEKTANTYFGDIKTIYRHFEIELHKLPSLLTKQINKSYEKDFDDLLTVSELRDAYYIASNVIKEIILFGSTSGLSKSDMLKLTVDDWFLFCSDYITTKSTDIEDILLNLKEVDVLIPTIKGERMKTKTRYLTFCSPEASEHIVADLLGRYYEIPVEYDEMKLKIKFEKNPKKKKKLLKRLNEMPKKLERHHKLFDISESHLNYMIRKINNKLGLGKVGKYTKFRCHQLRSFQASTLLNCDAFTESEIDALQGRKKDATHRAYLIEGKEKLFKKYYAHVDELMLFKSIHRIDEEEFEKLEKENNFYKKEIVKNEKKLEEQEKKIEKILQIQSELESIVGL